MITMVGTAMNHIAIGQLAHACGRRDQRRDPNPLQSLPDTIRGRLQQPRTCEITTEPAAPPGLGLRRSATPPDDAQQANWHPAAMIAKPRATASAATNATFKASKAPITAPINIASTDSTRRTATRGRLPRRSAAIPVNVMGSTVVARSGPPERHRELVAPGNDGWGEGALRRYRRVFQTDFTEEIKRITVPVLVMHGDDDRIVPEANSAPLSAQFVTERDVEDLPGFSARNADHAGRNDQRRPARVHPVLIRARPVASGRRIG